jgi:hypothetical protein
MKRIIRCTPPGLQIGYIPAHPLDCPRRHFTKSSPPQYIGRAHYIVPRCALIASECSGRDLGAMCRQTPIARRRNQHRFCPRPRNGATAGSSRPRFRRDLRVSSLFSQRPERMSLRLHRGGSLVFGGGGLLLHARRLRSARTIQISKHAPTNPAIR